MQLCVIHLVRMERAYGITPVAVKLDTLEQPVAVEVCCVNGKVVTTVMPVFH